MENKKVQYLVVDTSAFIKNAPLQDVAENIITCSEVVHEITSKRQLRRLAVLPYNLEVKAVFPENVQIVSDFAKKTGDFLSLSGTDIKVMALTYQLEKEKVGTDHLRTTPIMQKSVQLVNKPVGAVIDLKTAGFYAGKGNNNKENTEEKEVISEDDKELSEEECTDEDELFDKDFTEENESYKKNECSKENESSNEDDCLEEEDDCLEEEDDCVEEEDDDDDGGWITPKNIKEKQKQMEQGACFEDRHLVVGCMTTDFAMQNVLKQMNLNVCALDGRVIKHLRTFIFRCYSCFKTTSIMTKKFCPKCGNDTLKKVAVSLDENGKLELHINKFRPLTGRGKKYSLPTFKGGKHPNNPILCEDQRIPHNRPSRIAKTKFNPLEHDYVSGYSPFATHDVCSKSAQLGIRTGQEFMYFMKKNPNESRRRRKK